MPKYLRKNEKTYNDFIRFLEKELDVKNITLSELTGMTRYLILEILVKKYTDKKHRDSSIKYYANTAYENKRSNKNKKVPYKCGYKRQFKSVYGGRTGW